MGLGTLQLAVTGAYSGLALVQDINVTLTHLATLSAGGSAPTPSVTGLTGTGGVFWHDTSLNLLKLRDQADSVWMPWAQVDETNKLVTPTFAPVYGCSRNLIFTSPGSVQTAALTFDEWTGKTAIGGSGVLATNGDLTVNLASTGADGLDTGSPAANTLYRTYGLCNISTGALHTITTKDSNANPSPIPLGYVLLSVIGYVLTDGSSNVLAFTQRDREFFPNAPQGPAPFNTATSLTAQPISSYVPAAATTVSGLYGFATAGGGGNDNLAVAGNASGWGLQQYDTVHPTNSPLNGFYGAFSFRRVPIGGPLGTTQTIYTACDTGALSSLLRITSFTF